MKITLNRRYTIADIAPHYARFQLLYVLFIVIYRNKLPEIVSLIAIRLFYGFRGLIIY
ncbi:hypothetical protein RHO15_04540 [Utexia brackfieldae]|uniref:hypothetical protein n=1 Tax=Utexia brackfieldae TaxID=3074108 RepID=UPI00370DABA9